MVRICKEESFHQRQGFDIMMTLAVAARAEQKAMAQDALNRWWWPALMMFGPPDADSVHSAQSSAMEDQDHCPTTNCGRSFVDQTVPQAEYLGITDAGPATEVERGARALRLRADRLGRVLRRRQAATALATASALRARVEAWEKGAWFREAALAHAAKARARGSDRAA